MLPGLAALKVQQKFPHLGNGRHLGGSAGHPVLPDGIRYVLPVQEHPLSSVGPVVHLHVQAIQQGDHLLRVCGISGRLQRL